MVCCWPGQGGGAFREAVRCTSLGVGGGGIIIQVCFANLGGGGGWMSLRFALPTCRGGVLSLRFALPTCRGGGGGIVIEVCFANLGVCWCHWGLLCQLAGGGGYCHWGLLCQLGWWVVGGCHWGLLCQLVGGGGHWGCSLSWLGVGGGGHWGCSLSWLGVGGGGHWGCSLSWLGVGGGCHWGCSLSWLGWLLLACYMVVCFVSREMGRRGRGSHSLTTWLWMPRNPSSSHRVPSCAKSTRYLLPHILPIWHLFFQFIQLHFGALQRQNLGPLPVLGVQS